MLTDSQLRTLKPRDTAYKVADALGLYVTITPAGTKSFRYDYRLDGKRATLTVGRFEDGTPSRGAKDLDGLDFGEIVSLADARALRDRARRMVKAGQSPTKVKAEKRNEGEEASTFGAWAKRYFEFKADPKSGDEQLADSTLALRKSIYARLLEGALAKKKLDAIKPPMLAELFKKAKDERGPGPAVHARELVLLVYRFAIGQGVDVVNPVESIQRKTIATFKRRLY